MPLAVTQQQLQSLLTDTPFTRPLGYVVKSIGEGKATVEIPFRTESERPGGIVSGQVYMNAADVTVWLAIKTRLGMEDASVTLEMKTNFLRPCIRETIECRARILHLGRTVVYATAECVNSQGKLLTHHTVTYARPSRVQ